MTRYLTERVCWEHVVPRITELSHDDECEEVNPGIKYHKTWEDAWEYLYEESERHVADAKQKLSRAKAERDEILYLKWKRETMEQIANHAHGTESGS